MGARAGQAKDAARPETGDAFRRRPAASAAARRSRSRRALRRRCRAAAAARAASAIIAPLSVQSASSGIEHVGAARFAHVASSALAQLRVGADAAGDDEPRRARSRVERRAATSRTSTSTIASLELARDVGASLLAARRAELAHQRAHRGLEAGEAEVEDRRCPASAAAARRRPASPIRPAATAPGRPDSRGRAAWPSCRRPRRPRRRCVSPSSA